MDGSKYRIWIANLLSILLIALVLGAALLAPVWLSILITLLLLIIMTFFVWRQKGVKVAVRQFFKELFFGW